MVFRGTQRAAIDRVDQGANRAPLFAARGIVLLLVMALAGVEGGLDDLEHDIGEGVLQPVKLMGNETDDVQMTIVVYTTGHLKDSWDSGPSGPRPCSQILFLIRFHGSTNQEECPWIASII